jgi:hypothetical protein
MNSDFNNKTKKASSFRGPLFVVGMPRSGTKLIRDLLNNHPGVCIPEVETNFLATWNKNWQQYGQLSDKNNFLNFYNSIKNHTYFMYMKENNKLIDMFKWHQLCENYSIQGVFEALIRHDTGSTGSANVIWGDKSPDYIRYLHLLNELFPECKFIHIIRDVRDYCLSIHKAWGKNMLRAAQRWNDDVGAAQKFGKELSDRYMEIKYEDLITAPESVLMTICNYLGIEYDSAIVELKKTVDKFGDSKKIRDIKSDNKNKFVKRMETKIKDDIEAIAGNVLMINNYPIDNLGSTRRLSAVAMIYYQLLDILNRFKFNIKHKGIIKGVKWTFGGLLGQLKP